jgi:hypothetical protein
MFLLPLPQIITLLVINWPAAVVFLLTSVAGRRLSQRASTLSRRFHSKAGHTWLF